jgi:hypothetical protein
MHKDFEVLLYALREAAKAEGETPGAVLWSNIKFDDRETRLSGGMRRQSRICPHSTTTATGAGTCMMERARVSI